jgi:hypothetical protein
MNKRSELDEALNELRQEHRRIAAPPLEAKLLRATRAANKDARRTLWMWCAASAATAVILLGVALWMSHHASPGQTNVVVQAPAPHPPASPENTASHTARKAPDTANQPALLRTGERRATHKAHPVLISNFISLPGTEGLPVPAEPSIVRVQIRKGDLQSYGIEVPPSVAAEMIHADFFLGEDGVPRAIRLVL